ncbi:MAG: polysaccharide biosynthesis tyrosine autokinase [Bacteroidales bacterium]|nr:polysaccharide biosynthesis tyrosine autokinase [Bacteroidales bacterium]
MNQKSIIENRRSQSGQSDMINIRKLFFMIFSNWYYFVMGLAIAIVAAYFYNKYTIPVYRVTTKILIEEENNAKIPGVDNTMLEGFRLGSGNRNIENQITILSSRTLLRKTLSELPFDIDCYKKGLFKKVSYYPLDPIRLVPGEEGILPYDIEFIFQYYEGNVFNLSTNPRSEIKLDTFMSFGQIVSTSRGSFTILPYPEMEDVYKSKLKIFFKFNDQRTLLENYRGRLIVQEMSKDGTIIEISLKGTNKVKDKIFLDKLIEVYMTSNLEKKNHEANRIIEFINAQLVDVSDSLAITENQLQEFRSRNMIMDVSAQAQQIIDQAVVLENEKAKLTLESNYYEYLDGYLSKENNQEVPISPATMGIEDPLLARLMQELAGLQAEYFSGGIGEKSPVQTQLETRIKNTKQSLRETLQGIKLANRMALEENNQQINELNAQASGLPVKERQLLGIERKFNLNNVLYTFLLQKRAEAQIQKASNRPDNELVDPAEADLVPFAPNRMMIYLLALLMGLGVPLLCLILVDAINNKVSSEEDVKTMTQVPIVGYIPHSRLSYNTVVLNEPQSRIAESFRSLRARMEFFTKETHCPVILVTSSMPSEGKTFIAINLASAYSLAGKRTLLIGFDLRRPDLSKSFDLDGEIGLSTYLIGKSGLERIIYQTSYQDLYIIPSGPVPPNPAELSSSDKTRNLFLSLKNKFDFIIVDSAPIGAVSDNYPVATLADATLILVRHNQTNKKALGATLLDIQAIGVNGLSLLINDFRSGRNSYSYAYSYKYKYKNQKDKQ